MLTLDITTTLHVFPMYGRWEPTDRVMIVTTVNDLPVSEAYNYAVYHEGETVLDRDYVFSIVHTPQFRDRYDDVIMYAEPYTEIWCDACDCPRYPVPSGHPAGGNVCDACGMFFTAPF
jgi:hypothetical protein